MKKIKSNSLVFLCFVLAFTSCTKVIKIDLNKSDPKIVIEGSLTDQSSSCEVKLTKTINYDQSNVFPTVSGAAVNISDNFGNTASLIETQPGIYTAPSFTGVPGRVYTLSVTVDGKTYTAISGMNSITPIDTLLQSTGGFSESTLISAVFNDYPGIENYYRFVAETNGKMSTAIMVQDDKLRDGSVIEQELDGIEDLKTGDTVLVYLQAIDKSVYNYLNTLKDLAGGGGGIGGSATLANPVSNVTGGALGFFSAYTVKSKQIVIQ